MEGAAEGFGGFAAPGGTLAGKDDSGDQARAIIPA